MTGMPDPPAAVTAETFVEVAVAFIVKPGCDRSTVLSPTPVWACAISGSFSFWLMLDGSGSPSRPTASPPCAPVAPGQRMELTALPIPPVPRVVRE